MPDKDLSYYMGLSYPFEVTGNPQAGYFVSHPDLDGCMAEGATIEEAVASLADARELWIESRLERGYDIPEPRRTEYSGRISLRMPPSLHEQLVHLADDAGASLNLLINTVLASYAGGVNPLKEATSELRAALAEIRAPASPR